MSTSSDCEFDLVTLKDKARGNSADGIKETNTLALTIECVVHKVTGSISNVADDALHNTRSVTGNILNVTHCITSRVYNVSGHALCSVSDIVHCIPDVVRDVTKESTASWRGNGEVAVGAVGN